jgi:hypothetical protein
MLAGFGKGEVGMEKVSKVKAPNRESVEILDGTFESGKPEGEKDGKWRAKLSSRSEKLKYLKNGERYFHGKESYGSEKRKNPA